MEYSRLREIADQLAGMFPDEFPRVEFSGDQIVMMMSPVSRHAGVVYRLGQQLTPQLARTHPGYIATGDTDLEDPHRGIRRVPDLMVFHEELFERDEPVRPADVLLVCEVVSRTNPGNDHVDKARDYPAMGIPHYLIVDPRTGSVLTHSQPHDTPQGPAYAAHAEYGFGEMVPIGPWTIDSSPFTRYGEQS